MILLTLVVLLLEHGRLLELTAKLKQLITLQMQGRLQNSIIWG